MAEATNARLIDFYLKLGFMHAGEFCFLSQTTDDHLYD